MSGRDLRPGLSVQDFGLQGSRLGVSFWGGIFKVRVGDTPANYGLDSKLIRAVFPVLGVGFYLTRGVCKVVLQNQFPYKSVN